MLQIVAKKLIDTISELLGTICNKTIRIVLESNLVTENSWVGL